MANYTILGRQNQEVFLKFPTARGPRLLIQNLCFTPQSRQRLNSGTGGHIPSRTLRNFKVPTTT